MPSLSRPAFRGDRRPTNALPTRSAGDPSTFSLGRIICGMDHPYERVEDKEMPQAVDEVEEAAAAGSGGAGGGSMAEDDLPAPVTPAPAGGSGGSGLELRAGPHHATVAPELASRLIEAQVVEAQVVGRGRLGPRLMGGGRVGRPWGGAHAPL